jgi:hypothetical protein
MSAQEVTTVAPSNNDRTLTVMYDFGDNLEEAIASFGTDVVYSLFQSQAEIRLQAFIRSRLGKTGEDHKTDAEIIADVEAWKPGVAAPKMSAEEKIVKMLSKMSAEDQQKTIAALLAKAQAANEGEGDEGSEG